jgi:TELO2-interacting protein 1
LEPPQTPYQLLAQQIVARSLYFLTHGSPVIRAHILTILTSTTPVLHDSSLMPVVHSAWPFILNRLADKEVFVVSGAAALIEALATHQGEYMFRRIWDDVWPRFQKMLEHLDAADSNNALSRRGFGAVGTESAHTYSHRLYKSLIKTMVATCKGVQPQDLSIWQVMLSFRRFLHSHAHDELQQCARELYITIGRNNVDAVWLALYATMEEISPETKFLLETKWDIAKNVDTIFEQLDPRG